MSRREQFLKEAQSRWGETEAAAIREQLEKTADAVENVETYPLEPSDEPMKRCKESTSS